MRILDLGTALFFSRFCRDIIFPVNLCDIFPRKRIRFFGNTHGICSQVGNQTDCPLSFDIHSLIELLRDPHRL